MVRGWVPWIAAASVAAVLLTGGAIAWQPWVDSKVRGVAPAPAARAISLGPVVQLAMYFGRPDPVMELTPEQLREVTSLLERLPGSVQAATAENVQPGFRNFSLQDATGEFIEIEVRKHEVVFRKSNVTDTGIKFTDGASEVYEKLRSIAMSALEPGVTDQIPE